MLVLSLQDSLLELSAEWRATCAKHDTYDITEEKWLPDRKEGGTHTRESQAQVFTYFGGCDAFIGCAGLVCARGVAKAFQSSFP